MKLVGFLDRAIGWAIAGLFGTALALATLGILSRYMHLGVSLDWLGELVIFLVIWAILLAIPRAEWRSAHVRVTFFSDHFKIGIQRVIAGLIAAMTLGFASLMVWSGSDVVMEAFHWDERTPSSLAIPLWIYYASLPVAFGLTIVARLVRRGASPTSVATHLD